VLGRCYNIGIRIPYNIQYNIKPLCGPSSLARATFTVSRPIRFSPEGRAEFFDNGKRLKNKLRKQTTDAGLHCGCNNDRLTTVSDSIYV